MITLALPFLIDAVSEAMNDVGSVNGLLLLREIHKVLVLSTVSPWVIVGFPPVVVNPPERV